ncbi:MAG TPA: DUF3108 domain-containing protein [Pyrinomonadaceae bacterium]|jgi:hypothetical protein
MKYQRLLIVALLMLSLLAGFVVAQPASEESKARADQAQALPFEPAETLVYQGEFTRALLRGIDVADLHFSFSRASLLTDKSKAQGHVLHITAEAISKGIVSKLFGLNFRQRVESIVEPNSFSVLQTTKLDEQGKRKRTSEAVFDRSSGKVTFTELDPNDPNRPPRVVTSQISGTVQDIASAFYYLRTQKLAPGTTFEILISDTGQVYHIPVKVIKREQLKTVLGKVSTIRVAPELFGEGRLIRGKGEITIWFTDDARHIPVRAKINNSLGRLDIKLKSISNK